MKRQETSWAMFDKEERNWPPLVPSWPGVQRSPWVVLSPKTKKGSAALKKVEGYQRIKLFLCHLTVAGRVFLDPWAIGRVGVSGYNTGFASTFSSHFLDFILSFLYSPLYRPEHFVIALNDENRLEVLKKKCKEVKTQFTINLPAFKFSFYEWIF